MKNFLRARGMFEGFFVKGFVIDICSFNHRFFFTKINFLSEAKNIESAPWPTFSLPSLSKTLEGVTAAEATVAF